MVKQLIQKVFHAAGYEVSRIRKYNEEGIRWDCWPIQHQIAETYFEIDKNFHQLYDLAQEKTQMSDTDHAIRRQRHYTLNYILWNIDLNQGDVCELGVRRGLSAYQIASHIREKYRQTSFHIFDSFEGLSKLDEVDKPKDRNQDNESVRKDYSCSLEEVRANLSEFNFVFYYKGWIPEKFPDVKDRKFSFVHIDVDLYQPIKDSLEFFYPRLVKGGAIIFDDYGCMQFPGAKKAVDEYLSKIEDKIFFLPLPSGQAFLLKM